MDLDKSELQADATFLEAVDAPLLELHKSNILNLELHELLDECRLNIHEVSWAKNARDYVAVLSSVLSKLQTATVGNDGCPFILRSAKVSLLDIPKDLTLVPTGSYAINSLTTKSGNANVLPTLDCAIVVPNTYWNAKDYLNHRYMDKRNLILWNIAKFFAGKKFKKHVGKVQWRYFNGNNYTPALILTPPSIKTKERKTSDKTQAGPKFKVQIVMAMESLGWIPRARLFPNRSNIKCSESSTPYYNNILARDAFWTSTPAIIMEDMAEFSPFRDVLIVIKVWCLQRGFLRGHDSFDEMQIAVLLSYLFRTKRAGSRMAPLQVFTIFMKLLSEEWTRNVMTMPAEGKTENQTVASCENAKVYAIQAKDSPIDPKGDPKSLVLCHQTFSPSGAVLLNSTMTGNYLGTLSPAFCASITLQAKHTVANLTSSRNFSSLFMTNARFWTCLDSYFHVLLKDIAWQRSKLWGKQMQDLGEVECLSRDLVSILRRALGDRVTDIRILTTGNGQDIQNGDSDQIPTHDIDSAVTSSQALTSSTGMTKLVFGLKINVDNCHRAVDRGPPADDTEGVKAFLDLWGDAAELRRFKDGAIVHAVVWNTPKSIPEEQYVVFDGDDRSQGGIVERIVQHLVQLHCYRDAKEIPRFYLRDMLSMVEGVWIPTKETVLKLMTSSTAAHRAVINAFDSLAAFLRTNSGLGFDGKCSALGLPLQIDAVEPISPSLRYSSTFPAIPHPMIGGGGIQNGKVSGVTSYAPIQIQIRFGRSSKWPTELKAIGAAKTAMLVQLAEGIEAMKNRGVGHGFEGPIVVTPFYLTLGYQGYSWKIVVRADPELYLLRGLQRPSDDAMLMLQSLTKEHVTQASHHATMHGIYTSHPSAGHVVRLFNLWLAAHMLSGLIPFEAVELLVAKVYSDKENPVASPSTVVAGFLRLLRLVATYDWVGVPMIVDPQGHLSDDDHTRIRARFDEDRGTDFSKGPIMYIVASYDCKDLMNEDPSNSFPDCELKSNVFNFSSWRPTYTQTLPERVTLYRMSALAKRSYIFLVNSLTDTSSKWTSAFKETPTSLSSFGMLLRVDRDFIADTTYSSSKDELIVFKASNEGNLESIFTRSARNRYQGPKVMRQKVYRNLKNPQTHFILHDWQPIESCLSAIRQKLGRYALFFYNELAPEVIAVLWRPSTFQPKIFNAINSESVRPMEHKNWKSDSMVLDNVKDFMRELSQATRDIVIDIKVFDDRSKKREIETPENRRKRRLSNITTDSESEGGVGLTV